MGPRVGQMQLLHHWIEKKMKRNKNKEKGKKGALFLITDSVWNFSNA